MPQIKLPNGQTTFMPDYSFDVPEPLAPAPSPTPTKPPELNWIGKAVSLGGALALPDNPLPSIGEFGSYLSGTGKETLGGVLKSLGENEYPISGIDALDVFKDHPLEPTFLDTFMKDTGSRLSDEGTKEQQAVKEKYVDNWTANIALDLAGSIAVTMPSIMVGALTRSPSIGLTAYAPLSWGPTYAEARSRGLSPKQAREEARFKTGVDVMTEALPLDLATRVGAPLFNRVVGTMFGQGAQESLNSFISSGYDKGVFNGDTPLGEAVSSWLNDPETWKQSAYSGGIGALAGGLMGAAVHPFVPSTGKIAGEALDTLVSETTPEQMEYRMGILGMGPQQDVNAGPKGFPSPNVKDGYDAHIQFQKTEPDAFSSQITETLPALRQLGESGNFDPMIFEVLKRKLGISYDTPDLTKALDSLKSDLSVGDMMLTPSTGEPGYTRVGDDSNNAVVRYNENEPPALKEAKREITALSMEQVRMAQKPGVREHANWESWLGSKDRKRLDEIRSRRKELRRVQDELSPLAKPSFDVTIDEYDPNAYRNTSPRKLASFPTRLEAVAYARMMVNQRAGEKKLPMYPHNLTRDEALKAGMTRESHVESIRREIAKTPKSELYRQLVEHPPYLLSNTDTRRWVGVGGVMPSVMRDYPEITKDLVHEAIRDASDRKDVDAIRKLKERFPDEFATYSAMMTAEPGKKRWSRAGWYTPVKLDIEPVMTLTPGTKEVVKPFADLEQFKSSPYVDDVRKGFRLGQTEMMYLEKPTATQLNGFVRALKALEDLGLSPNAYVFSLDGLHAAEGPDGMAGVHLDITTLGDKGIPRHTFHVAMNSEILHDMSTTANWKNSEQRAFFLGSVAHEIGHHVDRVDPTVESQGEYGTSTKSKLFEIDIDMESKTVNLGDVMHEAFRAYTKNTFGLRRFLSYPLRGFQDFLDLSTERAAAGYDVTRHPAWIQDANTIKSEVFAQLHALFYVYYTTPENIAVLDLAFPSGMKMMKEVNNAHYLPTLEERLEAARSAIRGEVPSPSASLGLPGFGAGGGRRISYQRIGERRTGPGVESYVQGILDVGRTGERTATQHQGINVEVAPNPENVDLTERFNSLSPEEKTTTTYRVARKIIPQVLQELGVPDFSIEYTTGGYLEDVNPSIVIDIPGKTVEELAEVGNIVGHVLEQQAIIAYDEASPGDTNFIKIIPDHELSYQEQDALYRQLHTITGVDGYTWRNGGMVIGDFTNAGIYESIRDLLDESYQIKQKAFASIYQDVNLEETRYASQGSTRRAGGTVSGRERGGDLQRIEEIRSQAQAELAASLPPGAGPRIAFQRTPPVREGKVHLYHWGRIEGLTETDPSKHGTGLSGAERKRKANNPSAWVDRTYFGVDQYYTPEKGLGKYRYTTTVDPESLYDIGTDPDNLKSGAEDITEYEKNIRDAGYTGYWRDLAQLGMVAAVFTKQPVIKAINWRSNSTVDILSGDKKVNIVPTGKSGTVTNYDIGKYLDGQIRIRYPEEMFYKDYLNKKENKAAITRMTRKIADTLMAEVEFWIGRDDSAATWYDAQVAETFNLIGTYLHPEIRKDPDKAMMFRLFLAITSNGERVDTNFAKANRAYEQWAEDGKMPIVEGARKLGGFHLLDVMLNEMNYAELREFLVKDFTYGELSSYFEEKFGEKPDLSELVSEVIPGASVFGSKIGSFYNNLTQNFGTLTADLWFTRTWGRITGRLWKEDVKPETHRNRYSAVRKHIDKGSSLSVAHPFDLEEVYRDDRVMDDFAAYVSNKIDQEYADGLRKGTEKSAFEKAITNLHKGNIKTLQGIPRRGAEKHLMRRAIREVVDRLRKQGTPTDVASVQAILWYHEKKLYEILRGQSGVLDEKEPEDYVSAAVKLIGWDALSEDDQRRLTRYDPGSRRGGPTGRARQTPDIASKEVILPDNFEALTVEIERASYAAGDMDKVLFRYPGFDIDKDILRAEIKRHFGSVRRKGGTKDKPIYLASFPLRKGGSQFYANPITAIYANWQSMADGAIDWVSDRMGPITSLGSLPDKSIYMPKRQRLLGRIARVDDVAKRLYDTFTWVDRNVKDAIYNYLTDPTGDPASIPDVKVRLNENGAEREVSVRQRAIATKRLINQIGDALVNEGLIPEESRETYRDMYLPRVYLKHVIEATPGIRGFRMSRGERYKHRGEIPEEWRRLMGEITDPGYLSSIGVTVPLRDLEIINFLREISKNRNWVIPDYVIPVKFDHSSGQVRAQLGGKGDKAYSIFWLESEAARVLKQAGYMEGRAKEEALQYAQDLAELYNFGSENLPDVDTKDYRKVPNTGQYGPMRGMWLHKDIYDDIFPQGERAGYTRLEALVRAWKVIKVPLNYPTVVRNLVSNTILMNMGGTPVYKVLPSLLRALTEMRTNGKYYRIAKQYGIRNSTFTMQELMQLENEFTHMLAWNQGLPKHTQMMYRFNDVFKRIIQAHTNFYQGSEVLFKTAMIIDSMERGMDEVDAVMNANDSLFDYSLLPKWAKMLRRNVLGIPFLTFYYKAFGATARTLLKRPHLAIGYYAFAWAMVEMATRLMDIDDDDLEKLKLALPEWLREKGNTWVIPMKDEHNRWQFLDVSYLLPWGAHQQTIRNLAEGDVAGVLQELGFLGSPIPSIVAAYMTNQDPFTHKQIYDPRDPAATQYKDILTYMWRMGMPTYLTDIGVAGHMWRAMSDERDTRRAYFGEPTVTVPQAALRAVGINVYPIDPVASRNANLLKYKYEIIGYKQRLRQRLKQLSLNGSDEEKRRVVQDFQSMILETAAERNEYAEQSALPPSVTGELR